MGTPPDLFATLDAVYDFQLDAPATDPSALCARYFTPAEDGLAQDWSHYRRVWLNPPYGRTIGRWMEKAYRESRKGCLVLCLVPARTDTRWWHDWVRDKAMVSFLKGRLRYVRHDDRRNGPGSTAPFPSALLRYEPPLDGTGLGVDAWCPDAHRSGQRPVG